jgi:hypothetical protein
MRRLPIARDASDGRGAALCWRLGSAQARANRDNIGQASSGRTGTVAGLSSPTEHGPGQSLCPTREAGTIPLKANGATSGAVRSAEMKAAPD